VDPLMVAGRRGKRVNALLGHLEPLAAVDFLPDLLLHALEDQLLDMIASSLPGAVGEVSGLKSQSRVCARSGLPVASFLQRINPEVHCGS